MATHSVLEEAVQAAAGHADFAMLDAALGVAEEALTQQVEEQGAQTADSGRSQALLLDLGPLAQALPLLADLCAPLADAHLPPLLDRAATCCEHLVCLWSYCRPIQTSGAAGRVTA